MSTNRRTVEQQQVVAQLGSIYSIDTEKIRFLNKANPLEPWLPAEALMTIARQSGKFRTISEDFATYIEPLKQVVHVATLVDPDGRVYTRSGAATLGEEIDGETVDPHSLASARALKAVFDAAGFNPTKSAPVLDLKLSPEQHSVADQAVSRTNDLKIIHILAARKGLIVPSESDPSINDMTAYRAYLKEWFGVDTAAGFSPTARASLIRILRELPDPQSAVAAA